MLCWCGHREGDHLGDDPTRPFCLICWEEQRKNKPYRSGTQRIWPRHRFNERPYTGHYLEEWSQTPS